MRVLLVAVFLFATSQGEAQLVDTRESESYKQAVSLLNSGKIAESRKILEIWLSTLL